MKIKTVQPIDAGKDFSFTLGSFHIEGRRYQAGDVIDLEPLVSFTMDSNDLEYHFENLYSPVEGFDLFDIVLAPAYPGVSPVWEPGQCRWGRVAADLWIIKSTKAVEVYAS